MKELTCVHCGTKFHRENGYSGSIEAPYCLQTLCLAAYLGKARDVVQRAETLLNGFDNEHYRESQKRLNG
jgi:hypothetical protein